MQFIRSVVIILLSVSVTLAQPTRVPSSVQKPTTRTFAKRPKLVLKDGAPPLIKKWFEELPQSAADERANRRDQLSKRISDAEITMKEIMSRKVGMVSSSEGLGTNRRTDAEGSRQKDRDIRSQRKVIQQAKNELAEFDKISEPPEVTLWKMNRAMPIIQDLSVGAWGTLASGMKVTQVVNENELIVRIGDKKVWLSGFDTSAIADDDGITYSKPIIISKTKRYTSVLGAGITCLYAEPFPVLDYVELVEE